MGYAFISYSTKNQASADAMRELFNKYNIDTWMAPYDIPAGSEYAEVLYDALTGCACLVLMLTDISQNSQWVKKEVNIAITNGKTVIPLKLEDVELNSSMKLYLNDQQIVPVYVIEETSDEIQKVLNSVISLTDEGKTETINEETLSTQRTNGNSTSKIIELTVWSPVNTDVYLNDKRHLVMKIDHNTGFDYKYNSINVSGEFELIFVSKGFEKVIAFDANSLDDKLEYHLRAILSKKEISLSYDRDEAIEQIKEEATAYAYNQLSEVGTSEDIQFLREELTRLSSIENKDQHTNYLIANCASALGKLAVKFNMVENVKFIVKVYETYEAKSSYGYMFEPIVKRIIDGGFLIEVENKQTVVSLNKSQRKELMSYKCSYCGMYAEMWSDTDGYYAECVHCGTVGTIADTIDAAITNWKLCMINDNEYSVPKPCKDDVLFIESKTSKISACFDDTINSIDSILNEIQSVLDSNDDDLTDSECSLEKTELKQEDRRSVGYLALGLNDVLITKGCKQQFSNPITLRMPNNEELEFEFIDLSRLDEKYIIVSRKKSKREIIFSVFKHPEGKTNRPVAVFEGKKLKRIYRDFMERHKNEYVFSDESKMQPNIQPRKSDNQKGFTEMTASGMFGPYLKDVIEIPPKYKFIGRHVFKYASASYNPKRLSKLIIPDSVETIESFAFSDIMVKEIVVPDSVTDIGISAFNIASDGFIVCNLGSYAYEYARENKIKNSVDISNHYKSMGVCAYCGGRFSGLFIKKCSLCGKEKNY